MHDQFMNDLLPPLCCRGGTVPVHKQVVTAQRIAPRTNKTDRHTYIHDLLQLEATIGWSVLEVVVVVCTVRVQISSQLARDIPNGHRMYSLEKSH